MLRGRGWEATATSWLRQETFGLLGIQETYGLPRIRETFGQRGSWRLAGYLLA